MKNLFGYLLIVLFAIGAGTFLVAAQKREARVTAIIKDVRLMTSRAGARPASINDSVTEDTGVRTGAESRAELTFADETLTRLGANTVFSFGAGAKEFDLASGAMLLAVPKSAGTVRVHTAGATAAVSGFTALFAVDRMLLLEGEANIRFKDLPGEVCHLESGQMMIWPKHRTHCPQVYNFDVGKTVKTAKLIKLKKLPDFALIPIQLVIDGQNANPPEGGFADATNIDANDQKNSGPPMPPPPRMMRPPGSPPPSF